MSNSILELEKGQEAVVVGFNGGHRLGQRLEKMGVRPGKTITRISAQLLGGPVIVSVDGRQTAMGRGMASKVEVSPKEQTSKRNAG